MLRIYGVPKPILRELVKRVNVAAGISIDIEHLELTLRGWRALDVRYYSELPDDLEPIFYAKEVLIIRNSPLEAGSDDGLQVEIKAFGICLSPSVVWGVDVPDASQSRNVEQAEVSLNFFPDRIESRGSVTWLGARIKIEGTVHKSGISEATLSDAQTLAPTKKQSAVLPAYLGKVQFSKLEETLKSIQFRAGVDVDIEFDVKVDDFSKTRFSYDFRADNISIKSIEFSYFNLSGSYIYPAIGINEAELIHEGQRVRLVGSYDLKSKDVQIEFRNDITSKEILSLLPKKASTLLDQINLQFENLPQVGLKLGPAKSTDLLNSLSGSFTVRDLSYCQLLIDSLSGRIFRSNNRMELTELEGTAIGQEERAEALGSCMIGGSATGEVFWDMNSENFGVKASGCMDPNLFIEPLALVPIASNVIDRFKFESEPPNVTLELGAQYTDWSTFFINVHGNGKNVRIHEGKLPSIDISAYYKHGVLRLDPLIVMDDADFLKGSASINFINSHSIFDIRTTLSPTIIEDAVCPNLNLFGHKINTGGEHSITARGVLDWKKMVNTEFTAEVKADSFEIPIAKVNSFLATVAGVGPLLSVTDTSFVFYEGIGESDFSIQLDPQKEGMPYAMKLKLKDSDFNKYLQSINPKIGKENRGRLSGSADFKADLVKDFFSSANGSGMVSIVDGQLADLPLFRGFSRLIRRLISGFNIFSITSLSGNFQLMEGKIYSEDAYFKGDVISAKANGSYSKNKGFNAVVQAQILNQNPVSKVIQVITSPIFKLFEIKLTGTLSDPIWKLENFHNESQPAN